MGRSVLEVLIIVLIIMGRIREASPRPRARMTGAIYLLYFSTF
jgi:hypothetical protein